MNSSAVHTRARATLRRWRPAEPDQQRLRRAFLAYLATRPDACSRSTTAGHLTASTALLDHTGQWVLLTLHPRVGRWVQLGGHLEPGDHSLEHAALREAREESGITELDFAPGPVHLDIHPVTCSLGVPTRHFDVRFAACARPGARPRASAESLALDWWPLAELPDGGAELWPLLAAARAATASSADVTRPIQGRPR